ncbi:hypothetical protein [Catalinimonas alkaloidigena]|nr:hypothetical protein [Catalinimonas alkaloidigena]
MRTYISWLGCCLLALGGSSCQPKEPNLIPLSPDPALAVLSVYSAAAGQASLVLEVKGFPDAEEGGVAWAETPDPTVDQEHQAFYSDTSPRSVTVEGLQPGRNYYFRAYVRTGSEVQYSDNRLLRHQSPFRWSPRNPLVLSEGNYTVSSIFKDDILYVVRPVDEVHTEVWTYFAQGDAWIQRPDLPLANVRYDPYLFLFYQENLPQFLYYGGGYYLDESTVEKIQYRNDLWQYPPYGGYSTPFGPPDLVPSRIPVRDGPTAHFSLRAQAVVVNAQLPRSVWSFNGEKWTSYADFPDTTPGQLVAAACDTTGYLLVESDDPTAPIHLWRYDEATDSWTRLADFPGAWRRGGITFSHGGKVYYGLGEASTPRGGLYDLWQYDVQTNQWHFFADYPGAGQLKVIANVFEGRAYLGLGYRTAQQPNGAFKYVHASDFWQLSLE